MSKELVCDPKAIRESLRRNHELHTKEVHPKVGPTTKTTLNQKRKTNEKDW
jgi:hypothetical protein